jgi:hypothetical protein
MFGFLYLSLGICHPLRCHRNATLAVTLHKSQDKLSEYFKLKIIAGTTIALLNHFRHWPQGPSFTHFTHFEAQSFPLFPLRIYCVHLCSGSVSKNGKGAMWIDDNCNILASWHLRHLTSLTCDHVFRYRSPCLSHRPAGLILFEIRQPVPQRVRAATNSLLIDFWCISPCNHLYNSQHFSLWSPACAIDVMFSVTQSFKGRQNISEATKPKNTRV